MFEKVIADTGIALKALTISSTKSFLFLILDLAMGSNTLYDQTY